MFSVISLPVQLQKVVLSCRMYCTFNTWCVHPCNRKGNNKIAILKKDYGRKRSVSTALFSFVVQNTYNSWASQKLEAK